MIIHGGDRPESSAEFGKNLHLIQEVHSVQSAERSPHVKILKFGAPPTSRRHPIDALSAFNICCRGSTYEGWETICIFINFGASTIQVSLVQSICADTLPSGLVTPLQALPSKLLSTLAPTPSCSTAGISWHHCRCAEGLAPQTGLDKPLRQGWKRKPGRSSRWATCAHATQLRLVSLSSECWALFSCSDLYLLA